MTNSADTLNTQTLLGQNATPLAVIHAAKAVLGYIDLDPCSDSLINLSLGAEKYLSFTEDALPKEWRAKTLWMNPPGDSYMGGSLSVRQTYLQQSATLQFLDDPIKKRELRNKLAAFAHDNGMRRITAADWFRKLYREYRAKRVKEAICLLYRGGSVGSLPAGMLTEASICITCGSVLDKSPAINGSGRLAFETMEHGRRIPQTSNTQASMALALSPYAETHERFKDKFSRFGVIKS